jgi:hypothetical protein
MAKPLWSQSQSYMGNVKTIEFLHIIWTPCGARHNKITLVEECDVYCKEISGVLQTQSPYNVSCIQ